MPGLHKIENAESKAMLTFSIFSETLETKQKARRDDHYGMVVKQSEYIKLEEPAEQEFERIRNPNEAEELTEHSNEKDKDIRFDIKDNLSAIVEQQPDIDFMKPVPSFEQNNKNNREIEDNLESKSNKEQNDIEYCDLAFQTSESELFKSLSSIDDNIQLERQLNKLSDLYKKPEELVDPSTEAKHINGNEKKQCEEEIENLDVNWHAQPYTNNAIITENQNHINLLENDTKNHEILACVDEKAKEQNEEQEDPYAVGNKDIDVDNNVQKTLKRQITDIRDDKMVPTQTTDKMKSFNSIQERSKFIEAFFNIKQNSPIATSPKAHSNDNQYVKDGLIPNCNKNTSEGNFEIIDQKLAESELISGQNDNPKLPPESKGDSNPKLTLDVPSEDECLISIDNSIQKQQQHGKEATLNSIKSRNMYLEKTHLEDLRTANEKRSELMALKHEILQFSTSNGVLSGEQKDFNDAIVLVDNEIKEIDSVIGRLMRESNQLGSTYNKINEEQRDNVEEFIQSKELKLDTKDPSQEPELTSEPLKRVSYEDLMSLEEDKEDYKLPRRRTTNGQLADNTKFQSKRFTTINTKTNNCNLSKGLSVKRNKPKSVTSNKNYYSNAVKTNKKLLSYKNGTKKLEAAKTNIKPSNLLKYRPTVSSQRSVNSYNEIYTNIKSKQLNNKRRASVKLLNNAALKRTSLEARSKEKAKLSDRSNEYKGPITGKINNCRVLKDQAANEYYGSDSEQKPRRLFERIKRDTNERYLKSIKRNNSKTNLTNRSLRQDEDKERISTPRSIPKRISVNGTFGERLSEWETKRKTKLEHEREKRCTKETQNMKGMFKPRINERSKRIASKLGTSFDQRYAEHTSRNSYNNITSRPKTKKKDSRVHLWKKELLDIKNIIRLYDNSAARINC